VRLYVQAYFRLVLIVVVGAVIHLTLPRAVAEPVATAVVVSLWMILMAPLKLR
jgi:hypothetical protein